MLRLEPDRAALDFGQAVRELLADAADPAALRLAWDSDDGRVPGVWHRLADVDALGLLIPADLGGMGLDLRFALPALVESGRAALPEPLVETMVGASLLAAAGGEHARRWLPQVAAGDAVLAVALGPGELVSAAPWADLFVLRAPTGVYAVEPRDVVLHAAPSVDRGVRLATVEWQPSDACRLAGADPDHPDRARDLAAVAAAAQLVGLAEALLALSVTHAQTREQFGVPIGSFQAVKHQLADVYVANAFAAPVLARGAFSVAADLPTRSRDASHAKHAASRAAGLAARTALQVHGGIGYTYEHDLHMWMKRVWTLTSLWGDQAWHRDRVAAAVLEGSR